MGREQEVSVNRVSDEFEHQSLYRTKRGRWVRCTWSQRQGVEPRYTFVSEAAAKEWLQRNEHDDIVKTWFGPVEEEFGPTSVGGRPAVGTKVETRLPDDVLAALDARAAAEGTSRAQMIRSLVTAGLQPA
ncbi:ribbon-helix-helix protein, CopG family [Streptomyces sp. NBC_00654]|uniref:ribbon-helix-helix protein, CopG family n=1 Tax=Streptomyces sp. NBC_00654 TaxID=2975799 RepID=UPI00224D85DF|nr:ribbon-helix-helix protein, CopG family [Streptomyces sp. NBC_00654]MCX4966983.1 ribbon-helix-helix protein, CopG family [Streptomyces sp. NBC_00654]